MKQFSKDLGNVSLAPKGKWSREQEYERLNLVYNACDNLSYVAKIDVPIGVEIDNREYWQPINATGYADNNFINLTTESETGTVTAYESLEEAVATILPINRRAGATLSFYNLNSDRLDRQAEFELWQFNSTDLANWENRDYWNNIYYNWNVFAGWYVGADGLKNHVKIPNVGQYAYVGTNLNDALLYQCRTNGTWTNTGIKVRNYISVVVSGNITIGENGNWFSDGKDTGISATPAVDEQLDNIIMQLQQHTTEINNLKASDANLQDQITSNDNDITNLIAKHESLSRTVQGIAATGGASTATNVAYNNDDSGLNAENTQDAIDELQDSKVDKTSILQELGNAEDKVMSQKAVTTELGKKVSIETDNSSADLNIGDPEGNVLLRLENGHIKTKNFDSRNFEYLNGGMIETSYEGAKLSIKKNRLYYKILDGMPSSYKGSAQAAGMFNNYIVRLYDGGWCTICKLNEDDSVTLLQKFALKTQGFTKNHAGAGGFDFVKHDGDDFPYMVYGNSTLPIWYIENIHLNGTSELLQTINVTNVGPEGRWYNVHPTEDGYYLFFNIDKATGKKVFIAKMRKPSLSEGSEVTLTERDIIDSFTISLDKFIEMQDGCVYDGKLWFAFSNGNGGDIKIFELNSHKMTHIIPINMIPNELEDLCVYNDYLWIFYNGTSKYLKIKFD